MGVAAGRGIVATKVTYLLIMFPYDNVFLPAPFNEIGASVGTLHRVLLNASNYPTFAYGAKMLKATQFLRVHEYMTTV